MPTWKSTAAHIALAAHVRRTEREELKVVRDQFGAPTWSYEWPDQHNNSGSVCARGLRGTTKSVRMRLQRLLQIS
jgi:hypothetical protein